MHTIPMTPVEFSPRMASFINSTWKRAFCAVAAPSATMAIVLGSTAAASTVSRTPSIASTSVLQIVRPVSTPPSRTAPESGKKKL